MPAPRSRSRPGRRAAWSAAAVAAVVTLAVAARTAPAQGIGRDEGVYLWAAESYASFWAEALRAPGRAATLADQRFAPNHEHPPLTKTVYGATHALLTERLRWTDHLQGFRSGAFAFSALLSALLATAGLGVAGPWGALLAPALFWTVPRHFYHAHPAALDMPMTALWVAVVLTYRRSLRPGTGAAAARRWGLATGLVFGAALATKHNAWFLPPLLAGHWLASRWRWLRGQSWSARLRAVPLAFPAMAVLGPLVLLATWPWLWHRTAARVAEYVAFHLHHENYSWLYLGEVLREPPFPIGYPFVVTALTVPAAVLLAYVAGVVQAVARSWRALAARPEDDAGALSDDLLFLLAGLFPVALIAWPTVPIFGGVKHWMPGMPLLALLGARAIVAAARTLWPSRAGVVTGALAAFALAPAAMAVAHVHPYGTAAYNELAGGAPGAATLGMQRQFWGDDVVGLLPELDRHAAPGARVWWQETAAAAVRAWQRDGRVRRDLRWADGPEAADISIWHFHQEFRDKEFRTWTEFAAMAPGGPVQPPRPVAGLYLDEVPLVTIYARAGAWR